MIDDDSFFEEKLQHSVQSTETRAIHRERDKKGMALPPRSTVLFVVITNTGILPNIFKTRLTMTT